MHVSCIICCVAVLSMLVPMKMYHSWKSRTVHLVVEVSWVFHIMTSVIRFWKSQKLLIAQCSAYWWNFSQNSINRCQINHSLLQTPTKKYSIVAIYAVWYETTKALFHTMKLTFTEICMICGWPNAVEWEKFKWLGGKVICWQTE